MNNNFSAAKPQEVTYLMHMNSGYFQGEAFAHPLPPPPHCNSSQARAGQSVKGVKIGCTHQFMTNMQIFEKLCRYNYAKFSGSYFNATFIPGYQLKSHTPKLSVGRLPETRYFFKWPTHNKCCMQLYRTTCVANITKELTHKVSKTHSTSSEKHFNQNSVSSSTPKPRLPAA